MVELRSIANAQNEWVALLVDAVGQPADSGFLQAVFGPADLLAAVAPLECVVRVADPAVLHPPVLKVLPPGRVVLAVAAGALARDGVARRLAELQMEGYRVLVDGPLPDGVAPPLALRTVARDCSAHAPPAISLPALFGPHLAYGVDSMERFRACENAGFAWFSGDYVLESALGDDDDGTTRKRMLTMLALLARDADSHELEHQLKQDATLAYHLLKLVNSAAFSAGVPITSFNQAINRIGRRQLQRWLQLLLYARQDPDGPPNLLLPLAALRGAALEDLCKREGGERDEQDIAFMTGVFSLLDRLFRMPMSDVLPDLNLRADVQAALLRREGALGQRLRLAEADAPGAATLAGAGVDAEDWWHSQLHACHWAIQVARNV
ncbi:HDOD domain-containing protein [uncultured Massilia sp.]|uniref:HDOD domain-containing protein n=1 Tax=uncultured Massilia sp. TaxID=169973 RepID=UPI0025CEDD47|nr:HDOD domain-containing protein [uncultured Massilia sp.]